MEQKLFQLKKENLDEINRLLETGFNLGQTYQNGMGDTFIQIFKYTAPANSSTTIAPYFHNGIY